MAIDSLQVFVSDLIDVFFDPRKRVFWGYLVSAGVIAFIWLKFSQGYSATGTLKKIFAKESWWNRSAGIDYKVMTFNTVVMSLITPRLIGQTGIAILIFEFMHEWYGGRPVAIDLPDWLIAIGFTVCLFVLDDFARYWVHRLLHRVPVLWAFHKVHHSATSLNPITVFRTHPIEGVLFVIRGALVHGILVAVFIFFFGDQVTLITVFGASVLSCTFNTLGANLRHSHISIGFWKPVERIFISPAQHQIHHSVAERHFDKNFGVAFAFWDLAFGTHCHSEPDEKLQFGLGGSIEQSKQNLYSVYVCPFIEANEVIVRALAKVLRHLKFQFH